MHRLLKLALFGFIAVVGAGWLSAPASAQITFFQTDHSACPGHCTLHVTTTPPTILERDIETLTCSMTSAAGTVTGVVATVWIQTPAAQPYLVYNLTGAPGATVNNLTTTEMLPNGTALPMVVPKSSTVIVKFTLNGTAIPTGTVVCAMRGNDLGIPE